MSERLTLQDLVDLLSDKQSITKKDAETFLRELVALISETIEQKDFVRIKDFGTFKLTPVNARRSVDVNTGDPIEIPAHYKLSFTPDKVLREGVNKPFSHFESILLDGEVTFEDKDAVEKQDEPKKAEVNVEPKKVEPKAVETLPVVAPVIPKKEEPSIVTPVAKKEEDIATNKVDEVLKNTPVASEIEKEILTETDLQREEELADINSFLTKEVDTKKEVKPLVTSSDSSVRKETIPPTPRATRKYDDDDDFVDYDQIAQQKKKRNLWIGVGVFILLLVGVGIWGYDSFIVEKAPIPYAQDNAKIKISEEEKPVLVQTPVIVDEPTIEPETPTEEVVPVVEEPVVAPPVAAQPEQGAKEIEVKSGQTMRVLGMEYFGHGAFWVYIFEENRGKISRPDAVFAGMKLIIPPASKYDIDPNDKASVKKAQRQEMKLFGEFSEK